MRLACIVLAHRGPDQLALLLSTLRHPRVRLYLHLDQRVRLGPFTRALSNEGGRDLVLLPRHRSRWGGIEVVDAMLDGLGRGLAEGCDYFVLISGQDFPVQPVGEILARLEEAPRRSYLHHFPLPASRWRFDGRDRTDFYTYNVLGRRETCIPRGEDATFLNRKGRLLNELLRLRGALKPGRRFPPYARPVGGSEWWNLSREAASYVLGFVRERPDYRAYHAYTLAPDEIFLHSILLGTDFTSRHEIVNDALRFEIWEAGASHPRTLTTRDIPEIIESGQPFARKFDAAADGAALARLAERVRRESAGSAPWRAG